MTTNGPHSPSLGPRYSDTVSTIHPDRPIRPLPRRRIRSRISDEQAQSILNSSPTAPPQRLFQLPYYADSNSPTRTVSQHSSLEVRAPGKVVGDPCSEDAGNGKHLPDKAIRAPGASKALKEEEQWTTPTSLGRSHTGPHDNSWQHARAVSQSLASSVDSIDGYDSFENTNNKKKRKIPTNGGHQSTLSAEMASMGLATSRDVDGSQADIDGGIGHYYGTGSSAIPAKHGSVISSAGRSRQGRSNARRRSARSPLGTSSNGSNPTRLSRGTVTDMAAKENMSPNDVNHGIISSAMANAAASPNSVHGYEYTSMMAPQTSKRTSKGKTQFTFTCGSDSSTSMAWQNHGYPSTHGDFPVALPNGVDGPYDTISGQGIQVAPGYDPPRSQGHSQTSVGNAHAAPPRKPRRPLSKQYAMAARDRRVRQTYNNFHHPPKEDDVWICEYCEYEAIFGTPPAALIRQYEIKDRRERRRLAEKQRLLEKAKSKGRRGKRGAKNAKNVSTANQTQPSNQKQRYEQQVIDDYPTDQQAVPADENLLDDYDDEQGSTPTLAPQVSSEIPQPTGRPSTNTWTQYPNATASGTVDSVQDSRYDS